MFEKPRGFSKSSQTALQALATFNHVSREFVLKSSAYNVKQFPRRLLTKFFGRERRPEARALVWRARTTDADEHCRGHFQFTRRRRARRRGFALGGLQRRSHKPSDARRVA